MDLNERYNQYKELDEITIYFVSGKVRTFKMEFDDFQCLYDKLLTFKVPPAEDVQNKTNIDPFIEFEYWTVDENYYLQSHSIIINMDNIETVE